MTDSSLRHGFSSALKGVALIGRSNPLLVLWPGHYLVARQAFNNELSNKMAHPMRGLKQPIRKELTLPSDTFAKLAEQWRQETLHLSSPALRRKHPAYRTIVAMGSKVLPLILDEMRARPDYWFDALRELSGEDPVTDVERGRLEHMVQAWVAWGVEKGMIESDVSTWIAQTY